MPVIDRDEITGMRAYSSYVLRTQMEANVPVLKGLFGNVEILARALTAESSQYDLGKLENHINSMQTYTSLMEAAGQILVTRKNVRDPALLVVPNDILLAEDLEMWIEEKLSINSASFNFISEPSIPRRITICLRRVF